MLRAARPVELLRERDRERRRVDARDPHAETFPSRRRARARRRVALAPDRPSRRRPPSGGGRRRPAAAPRRTSAAAARRSPSARTIRFDEAAPGRAAGEAVRAVHLPVGAHVERRVRRDAPPDALDREPAAEAARAARVGDEAVALDDDRPLGLGDLDRHVRDRRARVREPVVAVATGPAAPRADDELVVDERLAVDAGRRTTRASSRPRRPPARARGRAARARRSSRPRCGSRRRRASTTRSA